MRLFATLVAASLVVMPAASLQAQPRRSNPAESPPPDELTTEARKRFVEGMSASEAGQYERARIAYLQAYALKQDPGVARNLAISEIDAGHLLVGARRLAEYLRGERASTETDDARRFAQQMLKDTEARIGRVAITVDEPGAEILVNGTLVGRAPIDYAWHVDPGQVSVTARKCGAERNVTLHAPAGVVTQVTLKLRPELRAASPGESPGATAGSRPLPPALPPSQASTRSTPLLVGAAAGGVLTIASLAVTLLALKDEAEAKDDARQLTDEVVSRYGNPPCGSAESRAACDDLLQAEKRRIGAANMANFAMVTTGVLAVGSAAAAVGWFFSESERRPVAARFEPWFSPNSGGLSVRYQF